MAEVEVPEPEETESCYYEYLGSCEYEVGSHRRQPGDCGEPAIARIWWVHPYKDGILVCAEHFKFIREHEVK